MLIRLLLALLALLGTVLAQDAGFYQFSIDEDRLSGAPDFSFLNHALTAADRIGVRDGHFTRAGDGRRVRMFGTNFAFGASFPEPADAPRIAKRLRKLGINLVRLHHLDSSPDRDPENCRSTLTTGPYPTLNPVSMKRMRGFLDALKAEGVYVNLNLHIGYVFRPEVDKVPALPEGEKMPQHSKPLHIFYPRMIDLQAEYARKLIAALNLKDDPVLAMVELDNETSLLQAWQDNQVDRLVTGEYKAELERQWNAFLKNKYHMSPSVPIPLVEADKVVPGRRTNDFLLFLTDRDRAYNARMLAAVREAAGKVPVTGTQMNYGGLLNLEAQADLDYQDGHFYIDHYNFPRQPWDNRDWRIHDQSSVGSGFSTILNIAALRRAGQPYTVSEFNQPWPNTHAAEIDPTLAVFGAFQDWDAMMHFAYQHGREWDVAVPNSFNINGDTTKYPNIAQSAWLFRSGAIRTGKQTITIPISQELELRAGTEKRNRRVTEFLYTAVGYDQAVALVHPVGIAESARAMPEAAKAAGTAPYRSDTGDISYDPGERLFLIHAPKAAGVIGFPGQETVTAGAIDVKLASDDPGFVTLVVTPLDDKPLVESGRLLVSTPGYTLRTQAKTDPPRPQKLISLEKGWFTLEPEPGSSKPSGSMSSGSGPVWMKRVESFVTVRTAAKQLTVYPLDGAGNRLEALAAGDMERVKGGFRIHLQADGQKFSPWYELVAKK
jgi:hypothetical protein